MQPNIQLLLNEGRKNISTAQELFDTAQFNRAEQTASTAIFQISQAFILCTTTQDLSLDEEALHLDTRQDNTTSADLEHILALSKQKLESEETLPLDPIDSEGLSKKSQAIIQNATRFLTYIEDLIRNDDVLRLLTNRT